VDEAVSTGPALLDRKIFFTEPVSSQSM